MSALLTMNKLYRKSYNNHGHHSSHGYGNSHSQGYGGYSRWRRDVKGDEGELSLTPYQDLVFQAKFQVDSKTFYFTYVHLN